MIVGLTHLKMEQDVELSNRFPDIDLIMGGHEHNAVLVTTENGIVAKADANAKTIYIHTITYDTKTGNSKIDSHLMPIDERVQEKPEVKAIVDRWNVILDAKIKEVVEDPNEVVFFADPSLDGTDSATRGIQTNLGEYLAKAMAASFEKEPDAALVNGGSIRIDDMLAGDITAMDVFRVLPFGGEVLNVELKGSLLKEILDFGESKRGTGAYLQRYGAYKSKRGKWLVLNKPIEKEKVYLVAFSDFLLKGYDIPFLTSKNPGIVSVAKPKNREAAKDIRKALIKYFKSIKK
jgi:2',3'-cyclic-nucleotide 2'-phosphodiesterase (5'-nucleotidase family)